MWHKNATVVGFKSKVLDFTLLPGYVPIMEAEAESSGWDDLTLVVGKQALAYFVQEKKHLPKSAVDSELELRCGAFEKSQKFAPGKRQRKEIKELVIDEMLPRAFPTKRRTAVWFDFEKQRIVIDSPSAPVIDAIQLSLNKTYENLGLQDIKWPAPKVVTEWLFEAPQDFTLDDAVTLQYPGEHGKVVKYLKADLADDDVLRHTQKHNAAVQSLAMTYDSRVSFVMTPDLQIRGIKALDVIQKVEKDVDAVENDFVLMTLELGRLIDTLIAEA